MLRTDLDTPQLTGLSDVSRPPSRFVRLTCSGILIISCTVFGFSQCLAQDVAEAARQAQKENQQKKPKHVYTEEDLKRAQILTPEDRAEVEARKKQLPPPGEEKVQEPIDAQAIPADLPLGDVARRYRRMRESLRLQQSAEFHLPFADEAVLAAPKPSVIVTAEPPMLSDSKPTVVAAPELPTPVVPKTPVVLSPKPPVLPHGVILAIPTPPRVEPFQPPVKRSPFERPRVFFSAPPHAVTSHPPANRVAAPQLPAASETPSSSSTIPVMPAKPAAPAHAARVMPTPAPAIRATPVQPVAPSIRMTPSHPSTLPVPPAKPATPSPSIGLMPTPAPALHATPAQPAAPVVPMTASRPSTIPMSPAKPAAPATGIGAMPSPAAAPRVAIAKPAAPLVSMTPSLPSTLEVAPVQPVAPVDRVSPAQPTSPLRTAPAVPARLNVMTVKPGDSLWKLAEEILGKGTRWHDLAAVNPAIVDPNRIVAGSQIFLPSLVSASHPAASVTVRKGDTLSEIALTQLGRASSWACIAQANPAIHDANLIFEGQLLLLPANCKR
jgi:nucleoid-associated protein YgaU